jgi:TonB family protein
VENRAPVEFAVVPAPAPPTPPVDTPTPPAPSGGPVAPGATRARPHVRRQIAAETPAAPVALPAAPTAPSEPVDDHDKGGQPEATEGSGEGGTGHGTGAGSGDGSGGGSWTPPVPLDDRATRLLPYTRAAIDAGVGGNVVLDLLVDAQGQVGTVRLVRGIGYGLDEIAGSVAKKIRFRPGLDARGHPVEAHFLWLVHFRTPPSE